MESTQVYELHLTDILPKICCTSGSNLLIAIGPELIVLEAYWSYAEVFFKTVSESMPT